MKTHGAHPGAAGANWNANDVAPANEHGHGHGAGHAASPKRSAPRSAMSRAIRARRQRSGDATHADGMENEHEHGEFRELHELTQQHPKMGYKALRRRRRGARTGGSASVDDDLDDDSDSLALTLDEENEQSLRQLVLSVASQEGEDAGSQSDERGRGAPTDRLPALDARSGEATPREAVPTSPGGRPAHGPVKRPAKGPGFRSAAPATNANGPQWAEASLLALMRTNQRPASGVAGGADGARAGGGTTASAALPTASFASNREAELPEHAAMRIMRRYMTACRTHNARTGGSSAAPIAAHTLPATLARVRDRLIDAVAAQGVAPRPCAQLGIEQQRFNLLLPLWMLQLHAPRQPVHHGSAIARLRSLGAQ